MKIDRRLNLVVPIERDGAEKLYVHSAPIMRETFERYYLTISKAFTEIYRNNLGIFGAPRVAAMILKDVAEKDGVWEGEGGVEQGLMNEIRRLSNVITPTPAGWGSIPLSVAVERELIDDDEVSEVENAIVFFILNSAMHRRSAMVGILTGAAKLWDAQITSLGSMEFAASLKTSSMVENSGENPDQPVAPPVKQLQVPY